MTELTVCVLNWNQGSVLRRSLPVIERELQGVSHQILVYDQASNDGSAEWLRETSYVDTVFFGVNNVGNSRSRNTMIRAAKGEYVLLLDADIIPIEGSIRCLLRFLTGHAEFCGIGYDPYCLSTTDPKLCTALEEEVGLSDVSEEDELLLSQYGLFRRAVLLDFPFPEFPPFDRPGWGAEDSILGQALLKNRHRTARVKGRVYWHKTHSSTQLLGEEYHRQRAHRRLVWKYFCWLAGDRMQKSLQSQQLEKTWLDLQLYSIRNSNNDEFRQCDNLGDNLFPWLLDRFFPFLSFNAESPNSLFFGGSVFHHANNLTRKPQQLVYFGCGLASEREAKIPRDVPHQIFPRGPRTAELLNDNDFKTSQIIGDPALCLAMLPPLPAPEREDTLAIADAFVPLRWHEKYAHQLAVARTPLTTSYDPVCNVEAFISVLARYRELVTSQVHPFLIALLLGRASRLIAKDERAQDITRNLNIPPGCTESTAADCRRRVQKQLLEPFVFTLIDSLMRFSDRNAAPCTVFTESPYLG